MKVRDNLKHMEDDGWFQVAPVAAIGPTSTVCEYVQLNPVRSRLLTPEQTLRNYPWRSSS